MPVRPGQGVGMAGHNAADAENVVSPMDDPPGALPLSEDEIVRLWEEARETAHRLCHGTFARLARGDGGFYCADDLSQDLFLEFWSTLTAWHKERSLGEDALWSEWRRRLARGAFRVIRRCPQRLWARRESLVDPTTLTLDGEVGGAPLAEALLARASALQDLVQSEDGLATQEALLALDGLEEALWGLTPSQRQIVYMSALMDIPAEDVAEQLGLSRRGRVYERLYEARAALRARLDSTSRRTP